MGELSPTYIDDQEVARVLGAVDEVDAALGVQRDIITRAMIGHQALHTTAEQDLGQRTAQATVDIEFLKSATALLPKMYDAGPHINPNQLISRLYFKPHDYAEANRLQALSLWSDDFVPQLQSNRYCQEFVKTGLHMPAFLLGARAVEGARVEMLLGTPARFTHTRLHGDQGGISYDSTGKVIRPRIRIGTVSQKDFDELEYGFKSRLVKYINKSDSTQDLPLELKAAIESGEWPDQHASTAKLRTKRFGRDIKVHRPILVTAAHVANGNIPLQEFDYPTRTRDLLGEFEETTAYKQLLATYLVEKKALAAEST